MFHSVANIFNIEINSHLFVIFVELIQSSLFKVDPRTKSRLGAKVLGTSVLWYSSTNFSVLVGTQYLYLLELVLKYF